MNTIAPLDPRVAFATSQANDLSQCNSSINGNASLPDDTIPTLGNQLRNSASLPPSGTTNAKRKFSKAAAYHEAAHAVARIYVGSQATAVEIKTNGSGLSEGTLEPWVSQNQGQYAAWDMLIVICAGVMAEARISHTARLLVWLSGGHHDYADAKEPIHWLVSHGYTDSADSAHKRAEDETRMFLRQCWPSIGRVANALLARGRLEAQEVVELAQLEYLPNGEKMAA